MVSCSRRNIQWDCALAQVKSIYNNTKHNDTNKSLFKIVYWQCSPYVLDLIPVQKGVAYNIVVEKMTIDMQITLDHMRLKLSKNNAKYKKAIDRHHRTKVFKE